MILLVLLIFIIFTTPSFAIQPWWIKPFLNFYTPFMNCSPSNITTTILAGSSNSTNITIWHEGLGHVEYYGNFTATGTVSSWVVFSPTDYVLVPTPPTTNYTTVVTSVPAEQGAGVYTGDIFVNSSTGNYSNCTIPVSVTVTRPGGPVTPPGGGGGGGYVPPTRPLVLDTTVKIEIGSEQVEPGGRVYSTITVLKGGGPASAINTNLTYLIKDSDGNIVDWKSTTVAVENVRSDIYYLSLPPGADLGIYSFEAKVEYEQKFDTASATFQVVSFVPPEEILLERIDVPVFYVNEPENIFITLNNTGVTPMRTNITLHLPRGFDIDVISYEKIIDGESQDIFAFTTTPRNIGIFTGFVSIKFEDKGFIRDFSLIVLPPSIIVITTGSSIGLGILGLILYFYRKKKKKRYYRRLRLDEIRYLVRKRRR
jgi:hypothetical protein